MVTTKQASQSISSLYVSPLATMMHLPSTWYTNLTASILAFQLRMLGKFLGWVSQCEQHFHQVRRLYCCPLINGVFYVSALQGLTTSTFSHALEMALQSLLAIRNRKPNSNCLHPSFPQLQANLEGNDISKECNTKCDLLPGGPHKPHNNVCQMNRIHD